jgi:hypothetical protein
MSAQYTARSAPKTAAGRLLAPDHQQLFGHVELGKHLSVEDLQRHYHQILFATGASSHEVGGAGAINSGRSHDIGLAQAALMGDRLQDRELAGGEVSVPHVSGEQAVGALTGAMQQM